ncbi:phosphate ABC transporter permease PstA [bacterium]|nr:phosphate ABC transporter permease PstA [bacterium]NBX71456.1 phosphate ABC transporter permease PstA [bacterium]
MLISKHFTRKMINAFALGISGLFTLIALLGLSWICSMLFSKGLARLNLNFFTQITLSPGKNGGMLNPIVGTLLMNMLALLWGAPIGILTGIYLAEYKPLARSSVIIRYVIDIFLGTPSIILGLFIYQSYVVYVGHFSGWAGSFALSLLVIPITAKTTENIYQMVSPLLKEALLSIGMPQWQFIKFIILRVINRGILTGILLSLSRIIGEAAPLLFTALNNNFWSVDLNKPMANLPVVIFNYAMSPFADWQEIAWTGSLVITIWVLVINILSRSLITRS